MFFRRFGKIDIAVGVVAEEEIIRVLRIQRRLDRGKTRVADRARRQTGHGIGVVGVEVDRIVYLVEQPVFVDGGDIFLRGVHLQLRIELGVIQTVVEHRGDDRHFGAVLRFALDDRRERDDLVARHAQFLGAGGELLRPFRLEVGEQLFEHAGRRFTDIEIVGVGEDIALRLQIAAVLRVDLLVELELLADDVEIRVKLFGRADVVFFNPFKDLCDRPAFGEGQTDGFARDVAGNLDLLQHFFNAIACFKVIDARLVLDEDLLLLTGGIVLVVMAELAEEFAKELLLEYYSAGSFDESENSEDSLSCEIVDNTYRMSYISIIQNALHFTQTGVVTRPIAYPYWENAARILINKLTIIMLIVIVLAVYNLSVTIFWLIKKFRNRKWHLSNLTNKLIIRFTYKNRI